MCRWRKENISLLRRIQRQLLKVRKNSKLRSMNHNIPPVSHIVWFCVIETLKAFPKWKKHPLGCGTGIFGISEFSYTCHQFSPLLFFSGKQDKSESSFMKWAVNKLHIQYILSKLWSHVLNLPLLNRNAHVIFFLPI